MKRIFLKHKKRWMLLAALLTVAVVIVAAVCFLVGNEGKKYPSEHFGIKDYQSAVDQDGDGIDDQTDILEGVRAYIATNPQYKSQYYQTGWPDDQYGVCTDVVARGLLAAGYDLRVLMAEDIAAHPERYDADAGDDRIDFRRVRNQLPYFEANAIKLTNDIFKVEEWQGGDIVIFKGHVGVVSDKRNVFGVPYIIHHGSPTQKEYEEDILGTLQVIGHYRIS